jgi:ribbon-helix-helix protein
MLVKCGSLDRGNQLWIIPVLNRSEQATTTNLLQCSITAPRHWVTSPGELLFICSASQTALTLERSENSSKHPFRRLTRIRLGVAGKLCSQRRPRGCTKKPYRLGFCLCKQPRPVNAANTAIWCIMGAMPKLRTNIYLDQHQKTLLDRLSAKTGAPVAELIRRAINAYLKSRGKGAT